MTPKDLSVQQFIRKPKQPRNFQFVLRGDNNQETILIGGKDYPVDKEIFELIMELYNVNSYHMGFGKCGNFKFLNPIPLTEWWLLQLGFKKDKEGNWFIESEGNYLIFIIFFGDRIAPVLVTDDSEIDLLNIEYVHQVQDLYFHLTGKELEIK